MLIECTDGTTAPTDDRGEMKDHWGIEAGLSTSGSSSSNYRSSYQYGGSGRSPSPSITNKQVLCGFVALGLIFSLPSLSSSYSSRRERSIDPLQQPYDPTRSVWDFKIIADLDQQSRDANASKPLFKSHLIEGILLRDLTTPNKYTVQWGASHVLQSAHNEAGRGMELSELISYKGTLYTVDDRTGIVFEVLDGDKKTPQVVPKWIIMEGDGMTDKGMKLEWATVKDDKLILGSFGKAYTRPDGSILNSNNLWVNVVDETGTIERFDWGDNYEKIRKVLGADDPGYVIHEAACWSPIRREWIFLPRRVSSLPYDEELDEKMGSNKIVIADETFEKLEVREVGKITPERGFSSFKFLPGSRDSIILALKSVEEAATGRQVRTVKGGKEGEMQGGIEGGTERLCLVSPHTH